MTIIAAVRVYGTALLLVFFVVGCGGGTVVIGQMQPQLGEAIAGLSAAELAQFEAGKALFEKRFTRTEGHGPDFNTSSCASCHEIPVAGGSAPLYRNFFLAGNSVGGETEGAFEDDQLVARNFSYEREIREAIPQGAQIVAQRNTPPLFGTGLFALIPAQDILANRDPADLDADGIRGRINLDGIDVGRWGFKAQTGVLERFIRGPIFNHMGITSDPLPALAQVVAEDVPTVDDDGRPDPELSEAELRAILKFLDCLAPPPPEPRDATALRGQVVFDQINCSGCHIPNLITDGEPLFAYTDLLLHDMGPELADGIEMGSASGSDFRTQPLWGVRHTAPFLHDGRADTLREAIEMHGGEATQSRDMFNALSEADKAALIAFLETL